MLNTNLPPATRTRVGNNLLHVDANRDWSEGGRRSLSGNDSEIVQLKYQIDDIRGNESPGDTNLRQQALDLIQE